MEPTMTDHASRAPMRPPVADWRGPVALSPDGQTLAFRRERSAVHHDLWVSRGGQARRVARATADATVVDLAFSPDGQTLAYRTAGRRGRGVGLVRLDEDVEVAPRPGAAIAFGPHGAQIYDPGAGAIIALDGAGAERVVASIDDDDEPRRPARLAVATSRVALVTHRRSEDAASVYIVDPGEAPRVLTDVPGVDARVNALWSPDERDIALQIVHPEHRRSALLVFRDASGGGEVSYAQDLIDATEAPAWSPDGRYIALFRTPLEAYRRVASGPAALAVVDLEDRRVISLGAPGVPTGRLRFVSERLLAVEAHDGVHFATLP